MCVCVCVIWGGGGGGGGDAVIIGSPFSHHNLVHSHLIKHTSNSYRLVMLREFVFNSQQLITICLGCQQVKKAHLNKENKTHKVAF